jgi:transposase InsO family protein
MDARRVIAQEIAALETSPTPRLVQVLGHLGIATSSWYRPPLDENLRKRPGPAPKAIPGEVVEAVVTMATANPWYGCKKIAVMCRRAGKAVTDREAFVVMRDHGLLQRPRERAAELYQAARLFELLPQHPNDLWQMDVTYIHIPGHGWWYAVTVIDYYSRYLLACHLTFSYSASQVIHALGLAREEAERVGGPLAKRPFLVTDNGPSFTARRFVEFIREPYSHVRIQYRTPQQLGLLERFHKTLKIEEVYWRLYENPQHARACLTEFHVRYNTVRPHWALVPEEGGDPLVPAEVYAGGRTIRIPRWQDWARAARARLEMLLKEIA